MWAKIGVKRAVNLLNSLVLQGRYRAPHPADSNFTVAGDDELVNADDWWQDRAEECLLISFQKVQVNIISLSENAGGATVKYKVGRDAIICSIRTHTRTHTHVSTHSYRLFLSHLARLTTNRAAISSKRWSEMKALILTASLFMHSKPDCGTSIPIPPMCFVCLCFS